MAQSSLPWFTSKLNSQTVNIQNCSNNQHCPPGCTCSNGMCVPIKSSAIHYNHGTWAPTGFQGITGHVGPTGVQGTVAYSFSIKLNRLYFNNSIINDSITRSSIKSLYLNYKNLDINDFYKVVDYVYLTQYNEDNNVMINRYNDSYNINSDNSITLHNKLLLGVYKDILNHMFGKMRLLTTDEYEKYKEFLASEDTANINIVLEIMEDKYNKNYYK